MLIALVRHGQTENNYDGKIQGRQNIPLNDTGRRQCERLKIKIKDKHFDYCYMSPLLRTVETAIILIGDRVETIKDDRLLERDMAQLEGLDRKVYSPEKYWNFESNCGDNGVETIKELYDRCKSFLDYIIKKHPNKDILIVTHAATFRMLKIILQKRKLKGNLYDGYIDNCCYEEFEIKDKN